MKVKTSVTLSPGLLEAIDRRCEHGRSRSEFLEQAAWDVIHHAERAERDARDIEIYRRLGASMGAEALESLQFAVDPLELGDDFFDEDFVVGPRRTRMVAS